MNFEIEEVEFDEEKYQKNIKENEFPEPDELDGKGVDKEDGQDAVN